MKNLLIIFFAVSSLKLYSQSIPSKFVNSFKQNKLDSKYQIKGYLKPSFLLADFNGDGISDISILITEKKTQKKGMVVLFGNSTQYFVFGAGIKVGRIGFDDTDDLKWMERWGLFKKGVAYETKFDNGDMVGSIKRKLTNKGIEMWSLEDGEPLAGGIIYWNGKKWIWIHEGE